MTSSVTEEPETAPPSDVAPGTSEPVKMFDDMLTGLAPEMPDVQSHAVEAAKERLAEQQKVEGQAHPTGSPEKGKTDDRGRSFDPVIHEHDDGTPRINSRGFIKCRRGGAAKPGFQSAPNQSRAADPKAQPAGATKTPQAEMLDAKIQATANTSAALVVTLGTLIGGEEFKPENGEMEMLATSFQNYYRIRGVAELPPEVMLAVAIGGYVAPRWYKPIFAAKRARWWEWIKSKTGGGAKPRAATPPVVREANQATPVQEAQS